MLTNYSKAWYQFKKTELYQAASNAMKSRGIKQPYRDNILRTGFQAGWNATGAEIKIINP